MIHFYVRKKTLQVNMSVQVRGLRTHKKPVNNYNSSAEVVKSVGGKKAHEFQLTLLTFV